MKKIWLIILVGTVASFAKGALESSHVQNGILGDTKETQAVRLSSFCLDLDGNILACDEKSSCIRVISPDNKLLALWKLDFAPQAIEQRDDGVTIVAGPDIVALLDKQGKTIASGGLKEEASRSRWQLPKSLQNKKNYASTAVAWSGDDIFVCARANTGYTAYRLDKDLKAAKPIITGLRGCCGQMDLTAKDGTIYVAANCRFEVRKFDRDGKMIGKFGKKGRGKDDYFVGCCEPKNVCFGADGSLYVSESDQPSIHRFSPDGTFLGRVGMVEGIRGCVRVTVDVSKDGSRVYMLDPGKNVIRVLERKG
ncbi:MAG: hypothetical protein K9M45_00090 [Kiritimatiellales bacterium]|nr:hypothetical protein [Kiritimatiellales bacterium]